MQPFNLPDGLGYPKIPGPTIKVRALKVGEYEYRRMREGDVFTLKPREIVITDPKLGKPVIENGKIKTRMLSAAQQFSEKWMEKVDDSSVETATSAPEALSNEVNNIKLGRK